MKEASGGSVAYEISSQIQIESLFVGIQIPTNKLSKANLRNTYRSPNWFYNKIHFILLVKASYFILNSQ